jgi:hypothetical protein
MSKFSLKALFLTAIFSFATFSMTQAHEPIFGIGPRTIWQYGVGFEAGLNIQHYTRQALYEMDYHAIYGVTEDWSVSLSTHQPLNGHGANGTSFGNLGLSSKYRFFRNDVTGGVYHAAVLGGAELPTGDNNISTNTTDVFAGLSGAYEGRRWLMFATARYRLNTNLNNVERGDVFLYDLALGIRPILTDYYDPDIVLMAELNGQVFGSNQINGQTVQGTSGDRLFAGFGAWITWRNWAFKPGIQIPVYDNVGRENNVPRLTFAVEFHI